MSRARLLGRVQRFAMSFLVAGALLAPVATGCGDGNGLVGGDCASGYAPCGGGCCPESSDGTVPQDGEADAGDASDASETSLTDGFNADRIGPGNGDAGEGGEAGAGGDGGENDGGSVDGTLGDGSESDTGTTTNDASSLDGAADVAETGPLCMLPLVDCGGVCVDTTSDPDNCGHCGVVCPSQICVNSVCQGSTAGGIVYIGHDYLTSVPGTAQARVLSNAAFIPQTNPLQVMSYEHYAVANAVAQREGHPQRRRDAGGARPDHHQHFGRRRHSEQAGARRATRCSSCRTSRRPPRGALAALGTSWATTLATFTKAGGIVVVLDGGTGVGLDGGTGVGAGQMPAFSTATLLLKVTAQAPIATGTPLDDVAPGDVVGVGVVSPYGAGKNSVSITTEANGGNDHLRRRSAARCGGRLAGRCAQVLLSALPGVAARLAHGRLHGKTPGKDSGPGRFAPVS